MPRLPHTIDFNEDAYPELADIFRGIDLAVAAIVTSDPAMRAKPAQKRRPRPAMPSAKAGRRGNTRRQAA
ncbi:MAG TPA: hypothetical protein VGN60_11405 [Devosia sp.]|jgi:hypothetical protein|nr:hypothetical protein [Devosia sp.]